MAECNLVGGPPHVWEPYGPVDVKCRRCGVLQNWQGAWDGLWSALGTALAECDELRKDVSALETQLSAMAAENVTLAAKLRLVGLGADAALAAIDAHPAVEVVADPSPPLRPIRGETNEP